MEIESAVQNLKEQAISELQQSREAKHVEALKVKYLGKKGSVQRLMLLLKECPPESRPQIGKLINDLKTTISDNFERALADFEKQELEKRLEREKLDVSLPGRQRFLGRTHVTLRTLDEAIDILVGMGFSVQYGPDIETDYYNFEALNFAKDHPARDMHDTFYITPDILLRTHTSNTQVRVMESCPPPIRIISPGKCYRKEDISARSHVVFHQIEALYIDDNPTFADLLATLEEFFSKFFQEEVKMRFRPSYFPFVEPGMEVDIHCFLCEGKGCSICKQTGWLEVAGAGMVHPEVLKSGGIDPEKYTGYAWAIGIERLALLKYDIPDIRLFWDNNLHFLQQF
ncbi:MAG: phenylalanine--tRNA ligase subunit alpha [Chlamydiales bacterium]